MDTREFQQLVTKLNEDAREFSGQGLTEQDTKNAFIEPIMGLLGFPKTNLRTVRSEYRHTSQDNPVDYALKVDGKFVMFVEAKALDKNLREHKYVTQAVNYASNAGIAWVLLTNGKMWDLYFAFGRKPASERLARSMSLSDDDFIDQIALLASDKLMDLEELIKGQQQVDTVRQALTQMYSGEQKGMLRLLQKETGLGMKELRTALGQIQVRFDSVANTETRVASEKPSSPSLVMGPKKKNKRSRQPKAGGDGFKVEVVVGLADPDFYMQPLSIMIESVEYTVSNWKELMVASCEHIVSHYPDKWEAVLNDSCFTRPRGGQIFDRAAGVMKDPKKVSNGYIETNLHSKHVVQYVRKMYQYVGVDLSTVTYTMKPKNRR